MTRTSVPRGAEQGQTTAPLLPAHERADVPVQSNHLTGKDFFIDRFPASIPQRASHWFSKTGVGKWLHKSFGNPQKATAQDPNRRDLSHAHVNLLKGAGPSMFERLFHRGRAKRYDALVDHIKGYHSETHHSPEKLGEIMDHIEAWKGLGEGRGNRLRSIEKAGAYISDIRDIAKSDRAKKNWGKAKMVRHDVRRKNQRDSELKHMQMQRAAESRTELHHRSPFALSSGLSDDDQDRQAILSHPLATGFDDVEVRQESVKGAAKRIGTTKYKQVKKRFESIRENVTGALTGESGSEEDARDSVPDVDAMKEGGQSALRGVGSIAQGDFSALDDVTEALGVIGGEAGKMLNVKKQVTAVRDHGKAALKAGRTANKAGKIKAEYNDAGHSLMSPLARMREVNELANAKNAVQDKGRGKRGTAWKAKQVLFGHNDRSKKHTIERHADKRADTEEIDKLMAGKAQGAAILGDLASNVQSQYAREATRQGLNTVSATADLVHAPLAIATAGASAGITKGIKVGAQIANVAGGTGEKLVREHNNRNAANTLQTSESQGDKALSSRQLLRNDLGAADKVFSALKTDVDREGRSIDIHEDLASDDVSRRELAMTYLKNQRANSAPRFDLNEQIRSARGLAGVAHKVAHSENARRKLIDAHGDEIHALHEDHKKARKFDSFDHNLGIDGTAYESDDD